MTHLIPVIILAGGESRRMGRDKALLPYQGVPMIERVVNALRPVASEIIIIANKHPERFEYLGAPVHPDVIPGMGPLSGLYTGFSITGADEIMLVACDMPMVSTEMARYVMSRRDPKADATIPLAFGREQGLFAVYRRTAIEKFRDRIAAASIQFDEFRRGLDRALIPETELATVEPGLDSFRNVNRPEELA